MIFQPASLLPLFAAACTAGLLSYLLPEGENSRMSGALKGVTGLCILLLLAQPLQTALTAAREIISDPASASEKLSRLLPPEASDFDAEALLTDSVSEGTRTEIEAWVQKQLTDVFGIPTENCRVTASVSISLTEKDELAASVEQVWIELSGRAVTNNPHTIEAYFSRQLDCGCTVSIGGGS